MSVIPDTRGVPGRLDYKTDGLTDVSARLRCAANAIGT